MTSEAMKKPASLVAKPNLLLLGFGQINSKVAQQLATEFNDFKVAFATFLADRNGRNSKLTDH